MKEIGCKFPLSDLNIEDTGNLQNHLQGDNTLYFSLCREALYAIARSHVGKQKVILLPAYTCRTVIDPFYQSGWKCIFFNVLKDLRIDLANLIDTYIHTNPSVVLVHPYYGQELNDLEIEALYSLRSKNCIIIEDLTQCIFSPKLVDVFDFFVGSYRKWYQIPDGAFLSSSHSHSINQPLQENIEYVNRKKEAMTFQRDHSDNNDFLTKVYLGSKYFEAEMLLYDNIECHNISMFSYKIMQNEKQIYISDKRISNYNYLFNHVPEFKCIETVNKNIQNITTAPLYFPVYAKNRLELQRHLMKRNIYTKALWSIPCLDVLLCEDADYIYNNILLFPIDQRYDESDMERIIMAVRQFDYIID